MALNIDSSKQLRTPRQLAGLLDAIHDANDTDESYSVEWKGSLDLWTAAGRFAVAKCILGMGNRPVRKAQQAFEGCAYMVIGKKPGDTPGVDVPDYADLEPWVEAYTGADGPDWSPQQVKHNGVDVLVIIIESPRDGDRFHSLRKTYSPSEKPKAGTKSERGHQEGTILVRHLAKSEPANTNDIQELEQRLLAGRSGLDAFDKVTADPFGAVRVLNFTKAVEDARYTEEEKALPPRKTPTSSGRGGVYSALMPTFPLYGAEELNRYERERQEYLRDFRATLRPYALDRAGRRHRAPFALQIANDSDTILTDVQIRVAIPDDLHAFAVPGDNPVELPERPKDPSTFPITGFTGLQASRFKSPDMSGMFDRYNIAEDRRSVIFTITDIHPHRFEKTDAILLFTTLNDVGAGNINDAGWDLPVSITAANRSGQWEGSAHVSAVATVLAEENLLPPITAAD